MNNISSTSPIQPIPTILEALQGVQTTDDIGQAYRQIPETDRQHEFVRGILLTKMQLDSVEYFTHFYFTDKKFQEGIPPNTDPYQFTRGTVKLLFSDTLRIGIEIKEVEELVEEVEAQLQSAEKTDTQFKLLQETLRIVKLRDDQYLLEAFKEVRNNDDLRMAAIQIPRQDERYNNINWLSWEIVVIGLRIQSCAQGGQDAATIAANFAPDWENVRREFDARKMEEKSESLLLIFEEIQRIITLFQTNCGHDEPAVEEPLPPNTSQETDKGLFSTCILI